MDKKLRERRRSVNRERGRRRAGLIIAAVAVAAAGIVFLWLRSSEVFAVHTVTVTPLVHVDEKQVGEATQEARGQNLLALSVAPIEEDLETLPYVRDARVLRRFPNTLEVRVLEHTPAAALRTGAGETWLLSDDGRLLEKKAQSGLVLFRTAAKVTPEAGEYVPSLVAAALPLASLVEEMEAVALLPPIDHITVALTGEVTVRYQGGAELRLGEPTQLKQKLTVAGTIIQQYLRDGKHIEYVDVSVPDRVAVKAG